MRHDQPVLDVEKPGPLAQRETDVRSADLRAFRDVQSAGDPVRMQRWRPVEVEAADELHKVEAVTRGARYASFFWTQSLVREDSQRALLFEMDQAIQQLSAAVPEHPALLQLTGNYHNLLRRWADV